MKSKKVLALTLAAALSVAPIVSLADAVKAADKLEESQEVQEVTGEYVEYHGKIKNLSQKEGKYTLLVENMDGEDELILHVGQEVYVDDMTLSRENKRMRLEEGAEVKVFYHRTSPVALSMPPQLTPKAVIVINSDLNKNVKLDRFDKDLLSSDKTLKLNIKEEERKDYMDKDLLVFYDATTKSLPAQTSPKLIIIMNEKEAKEKERVSEGEKFITVLDRMIINGNQVEMDMYRKSKDVVMIPLRDLADALGYKIVWKGKDKPIEISKGAQWTSISLDENQYIFAKMAPMSLEAAPELKDSKTYVPASFIEKILRADRYEVKDGLLIVE